MHGLVLEDVPDVGTTVRVLANFETLDDPAVPIDPATITCVTKDPHGIEMARSVIRDKRGEYHAEIAVLIAGQWRYRFETTGPVRAVEGSFVVRKSAYSEFEPSSPGMTWPEWNALTYGGYNEMNWGQFQ